MRLCWSCYNRATSLGNEDESVKYVFSLGCLARIQSHRCSHTKVRTWTAEPAAAAAYLQHVSARPATITLATAKAKPTRPAPVYTHRTSGTPSSAFASASASASQSAFSSSRIDPSILPAKRASATEGSIQGGNANDKM